MVFYVHLMFTYLTMPVKFRKLEVSYIPSARGAPGAVNVSDNTVVVIGGVNDKNQ